MHFLKNSAVDGAGIAILTQLLMENRKLGKTGAAGLDQRAIQPFMDAMAIEGSSPGIYDFSLIGKKPSEKT